MTNRGRESLMWRFCCTSARKSVSLRRIKEKYMMKKILYALVACLFVCVMAEAKTLSLKMPCKLLSGITERDYSIYLPDSYGKDVQKTYPVLYLLHGGGLSR